VQTSATRPALEIQTMTTPQIPKKYQRTTAARARYIEGWQDAQAGKTHGYTGADADLFIMRQGKAQLDAYTDGYQAGGAPTTSDIIARANALLDELERTPPDTLHLGNLGDLADRLHHVAEMIETYTDSALASPDADKAQRAADELGE